MIVILADKKELEDLAMLLAAQAVRNNTPLESLHAAGKINQQEMEALMRAVTDQLHSYLVVVQKINAIPQAPFFTVPDYWARPQPTLLTSLLTRQ